MYKMTGLVLAGGAGRRMGGVDKGLIALRGRVLVAHVLERLAPQVSEILISANRNLDRYRGFGCPLVPDSVFEKNGGLAGPLAGLHAGLEAARYPLILTVPCDSPLLPADLASRLLEAYLAESADLAVARTDSRIHPVFALYRRTLLPNLTTFLEGGGRRLGAWHAGLNVAAAHFGGETEAFTNINTPAELRAFE